MKTTSLIFLFLIASNSFSQKWLEEITNNGFSFAQKRSNLTSTFPMQQINLEDTLYSIQLDSCEINYFQPPFYRKRIRGLFGQKLANGIAAYYSTIESDQIILYFFENYLIYYSIITPLSINTNTSLIKHLNEFNKSKLQKFPNDPRIIQIAMQSFENQDIKVFRYDLKCGDQKFSFYDFININFQDRIPFWCPVGESKKSSPKTFLKHLEKLHKKKFGK